MILCLNNLLSDHGRELPFSETQTSTRVKLQQLWSLIFVKGINHPRHHFHMMRRFKEPFTHLLMFDIYFFEMTLNVPVNNQGIPMALNNQRFLFYRSKIQFQVKIDNLGKKELKGTAFLTTHRIIFVSDKPTPDFWSFDVPIITLFNESVEFPIFGTTYLKGSCKPNQNLLPGLCHFKLWFSQGGCDTFIRNLSNLIKQVRKFSNNMDSFTQNSGMYSDMRNGNFRNQAFVDPNDPSQIFMEQPKY